MFNCKIFKLLGMRSLQNLPGVGVDGEVEEMELVWQRAQRCFVAIGKWKRGGLNFINWLWC